MSQLFVNARLRVRERAVVHITKQLPSPNGKFSVAVGQEVSPGEIIGEGHTPLGFRAIHLAASLGVAPKAAQLCLKRKIGQTIYQGELLAEGKGLLGLKKKILTSPADGVLDFYDESTGNLRVKLIPKAVKLISGVYGVVDEINTGRCIAKIRTLATLVYGVLGSGKEREGTIRVLGSAESLISAKLIPGYVLGNILVVGCLILPDALLKIASLRAGGVIAGGIGVADYQATTGGRWHSSHKSWSDVGVTLMATEGFGAVPLGEDIFPLLKKHEGKYAFLDGNRARLVLPTAGQESMIYIRKAKLPAGSFIEPEPEEIVVELQVGARVRVLSVSLMGSQGVVAAIDKSLTELPSGVKTVLVTVVTRTAKLRVPYQNLEVIGNG